MLIGKIAFPDRGISRSTGLLPVDPEGQKREKSLFIGKQDIGQEKLLMK